MYNRLHKLLLFFVQDEVFESLTEKVRSTEAVHDSLKQDLESSKQQLAFIHNELGVLKESQVGLEQSMQDLRMENKVLKVWDYEKYMLMFV